MKTSLLRLLYKLDELSLRERLEVLIGIIVFILVFWFFVIFNFQMKAIKEKKGFIANAENQTNSLVQKRQIILSLANSFSTAKLLQRHEELTVELQALEQKIDQYQHRYFSTENLSQLLFAVLEGGAGVTIDSFYSVSEEIPQIPPPVAKAPPKTGPTAAATAATTPPPPIIQTVDEKTRYLLGLRGDYFSIMRYLEHLEKFRWQLYWDKFNYQVVIHPQATVTIEFYTLKPQKGQIKPTQGTVK